MISDLGFGFGVCVCFRIGAAEERGEHVRVRGRARDVGDAEEDGGGGAAKEEAFLERVRVGRPRPRSPLLHLLNSISLYICCCYGGEEGFARAAYVPSSHLLAMVVIVCLCYVCCCCCCSQCCGRTCGDTTYMYQLVTIACIYTNLSHGHVDVNSFCFLCVCCSRMMMIEWPPESCSKIILYEAVSKAR